MYTKGKWKIIDRNTENAPMIGTEDYLYIGEVYNLGHDVNQTNKDEAEANAKRICQCVNNFDELLEACERLINAYSPLDGEEPQYIKCIKQSIAKAKGE